MPPVHTKDPGIGCKYCFTSSFNSLASEAFLSLCKCYIPVSEGKTPEKVSLKNLFISYLSILSRCFNCWLIIGYWSEVIDEKCEPNGFYMWIEPLNDWALLELVRVCVPDRLLDNLPLLISLLKWLFMCWMFLGCGV